MRSLSDAHDQLQNSWRLLHLQWEQTCTMWNDPLRHHFEKSFWQATSAVPGTIDELQKLADVIAKARRQVG
jgi:hypothetical protein